MQEHDLIHLLSPILHTLSSLHAYGIFHNDLKLDNIFLLGSGPHSHGLLGDWGLALRVSQNHNGPLTLSGTPAYMAPEILLANHHAHEEHHTYAQDVWALAIMMLELLGTEYGSTQRMLQVRGDVIKASISKNMPALKVAQEIYHSSVSSHSLTA